METYDTPKFYILQHYNGDLSKLGVNDNGCINAYYVNSNGKDKVALGRPEQATRFNTIGEAMTTSARLFKEPNGIRTKVIPIYNPDTISRKPKSK